MKMYRYMCGSDYRIVSDEFVRQARETAGPAYYENADKVLKLELNESIDFESGVSYTRVADDTPPVEVIVCTRTAPRRCQFCGKWVHGEGLLCDGPPKPKSRRKTCDAFMCRGCARHVGKNRDLCPTCVAAGAQLAETRP